MTTQELNAELAINTTAIDGVSPSDFPNAAPVAADSVAVTPNATNKVVSTQQTTAQGSGAAQTVSFIGVTTSDEITIETLNKAATTLSESTNAAFASLKGALDTALQGVSTSTTQALGSLVNDINNKFANLKGEQDTFAGDVNQQFSDLLSDINAAFALISEKEQAQSNAVAAKINTVVAQANAQISALKDALAAAHDKIQALDETYATDSDIAAKIANINALVNTLKETDLDFVSGIKQTVEEINLLERFKSKEFLIAATSGVYNVNLLGEGFPEAVLSSDYRVTVTPIDNIKVECLVINKTKDGFDVKVMSKGVHFVPQPVDCSVTPLKVNVVVYNEKKNALTFNVDTLNSSFVTSGAGTDANAI